MRRGLLLAGLGAVFLILAPSGGADEEKSSRWNAPLEMREIANPVPASPESLLRGKALYANNCLSCHGVDGNGQGPVAVRLGFSAGDLGDGTVMRRETDGGIFWKISTGRDPMPTFKKKEGGLTDPEIWDLVNFVRTLPRPQSVSNHD